ncbi:MAG: hypothetical protein DIU63_10265 [Proteobacteria bacterium]|jgi:hypothetical protein|nr:MAG: hypothetical protein DIU63_10265 [Pseudomonadota bacterium]
MPRITQNLFRRAPAILLGIGAVTLVIALIWWALVFSVVLEAEVLTPREAGICLFDTSGLCQAIASLCSRDHVLNIRVYEPEAFWLAVGLIGAGTVAAFARWLRPRSAA